jgi:hypothetical protein
MSIESELATDIKNIQAVSALVADRVWPVAAPQTSGQPFVTYRRVPGDVLYTHDGESRVQKAYFQIAAVAVTYEGAIELADAVRDGLSGRHGEKVFLFRSPEDTWNQETGLFVRNQECTITYRKGA